MRAKIARYSLLFRIIPAKSPTIPSAAITTTGTAPARVDVGVGVAGAVTAVVVTTGVREIICADTVRVLPPGRPTVVFQE